MAIKKNIIDEGVEDSELNSEILEKKSEKKSEKTPNRVSNKTNGISINVGDTLEVKSIGDGEIVLAIPSQEQAPEQVQEEESEENSEGSFMVR